MYKTWQVYLDPDLYTEYLLVCFVALRPKPIVMVMAEPSVYLTTPFPGQA